MQKLSTLSVGAHPLTLEQRRELWAKVDAADAHAANFARKRAVRLPYERSDVTVRVTHPGGGCTTRAVLSHDLSSGGIAFLHPGFLHIGTAVMVTLPRRLMGEDLVSGRITSCRHVAGVWHAMGVKFAEPIFPKLFIDQVEWNRLPNGDAMRPQDLVGQVLLLDDQELDQYLFSHMLRETRLNVTTVSTLEQALTEVGKAPFDVICVDLNLGIGQPPGEQAIVALRMAGYRGVFIVISGDTAARLESAREMGASLTLFKPYEAEQLWTVLGTATNAASSTQEMQPLYSELANQQGITPLLQQFCDKVQGQLRELKRGIDARDIPSVRLFCQMLRGAASGFGYPVVSAAAGDAIKALDAGGDVSEAVAELQKLQVLCRRLFPGKRA